MHRIAFAAILSIFIASPALAEGEIVITQAKAIAGNVTPGDTAGFPVTLSRPGAYVMASNLTVTAGSYGFQITSHNVDIDMNGFVLSGGGVANYGLVSHYYGESRIHDGVINTFRSYGIYVRNNAWTIENMKIVRNGGSGIDANGASFIAVNNSLIATNGGYGVITGDNGSFRNSTFSGNKAHAIYCGDTCHAEGNIITKNLSGISFTSGMVLGNTIARNTSVAVYDITGAADTGFANNMLIENYPSGTTQTLYVAAIHPNTCIGKPC